MNGWRELDPREVPAVLLRAFPSYRGRTFRARVAESIDLTDAYWDGGSRTTYRAVHLPSGRVTDPPRAVADPPQFGGPRGVVTSPILPDWCIVGHVIFCGKDHGLEFTVHPSAVAALLPPPADGGELSDAARVVLLVSSFLISKARRDEAARAGILGPAYDVGLGELKRLGFVTAGGALTIRGKNLAASDESRAFARSRGLA